MNWTTETPSENGWYWLKVTYNSEPEVVLVRNGEVLFAGNEVECGFHELSAEQWLGPIEPPVPLP